MHIETSGVYLLRKPEPSGENAHDVAFLHDEQLLPIDLHFGAGPLAEQHLVALLKVERNQLAGLVASTRADGERRPGWVGQPVTGAQTRIHADDGTPVPHDGESIGRLQVRGPMLFDGYLNLPEVTASCWTDDGWFVTGDLAAIDAEGFHRIVGRESVDLIKSGGYRIGAGEIETSLLARPEVAEVAVVGAPDDDLGQRIVAFVVTDSAHDGLADSLISHVAEDLSWHKRPREIRFVPALPRNAMGKVQKKALM